MNYDQIEVDKSEVEDPTQLELFNEIDIAPERPEEISYQHEDQTEKIVHHIRSPDPPLVEASVKMARALAARSRALVLKIKYISEE